jgi:phosphoribosylanthranilate isomerase
MSSSSPLVKVCGITRARDGAAALEAGASHIGFILYEQSPRAITLEQVGALMAALPLPVEKPVAVEVNPDPERLAGMATVGFARYQLHFPHDLPRERIAEWAEIVGRENLWLAPKLPPDQPFPENLLEFAEAFLIDAFAEDAYGGTGHTADWSRFAGLKERFPEKKWILAGGLSPDNVVEAIAATGAGHIDANSGVESAPGIKDPEKIKALFKALANG